LSDGRCEVVAGAPFVFGAVLMLVAIGIASTIDGTSGQGLLHEHRQQNPHTEEETVTPMSEFDEEAGRLCPLAVLLCRQSILLCPALPCPALPCPALPLLMLGNRNCGGDLHYSFPSCCFCLASLPCPWARRQGSEALFTALF